MVDRILAAARSLVGPDSCHWCSEATVGTLVCASCDRRLPRNTFACRACAIPLEKGPAGVCLDCLEDSPPQDSTWAAFRYEPAIANQIVGLKFHGQFAPAHVLGGLMAAQLARRPEPMPDLLIPVPLHVRRLGLRGYNQALELGRQISLRLTVPLAPFAARRVRPTREQTRLTAAERRRNLRGVFEVGEIVRGRHIALLDDVITTGATVAELACAARRAGAARIEVWAAARAERRDQVLPRSSARPANTAAPK